MDHQARNLYANQPDEATQNEIEHALIEAFNCASQLSISLNPASDSELHVRLVPYGEEPIIIRRNEGARTCLVQVVVFSGVGVLVFVEILRFVVCGWVTKRVSMMGVWPRLFVV